MPPNMAGIILKSHSGLPINSPTIESPAPTAQAFQIPWMATAVKYAAKNFAGSLLTKSRDNSPADQPRSGHVQKTCACANTDNDGPAHCPVTACVQAFDQRKSRAA